MKQYIAIHVMISMVISLCLVFPAFSGKKPAMYPIKVSSTEVANRIVESKVRGHLVLSDQPKAFKADDVAPTPPEYLIIAYNTCVVSTLRFVAMLENLDVKNIEVSTEGEIDFSKAMGISTENRAGLLGLRVNIRFDSAMSPDERKDFVKKAMERGAAIDNILNTTPISYQVLE